MNYKLFRKLIATILAVLSLCVIFSGCNKKGGESGSDSSESKIDNYPVKVFDVEFEKAPEKIAVFNPAIVEMFFDLGYGGKIVAVGENCSDIGSEHSGKLEKIEVCGSLLAPDIDKLKQLGVELIFSQSEFDDETNAKISVAKITHVILAPVSSLAMIKEQYLNLGKVFSGKTTGAASGAENYKKVETEVNYIVSILADRKIDKIATGIYLAEKDNVVATPDTLIGEMLSKVGMENLANGSKNWHMDDLEDKKDKIEVIFCTLELVDFINESSFFKDTPAVKNKCVFGIDGKTIERKGMSFFKACGSMANMLKAYVYPDAPEATTASSAVTTATTDGTATE